MFNIVFLAILKKKQDLENRELEEEPQLTETKGRFETYTGKNHFLSKSPIVESLNITSDQIIFEDIFLNYFSNSCRKCQYK